MIDDTITLDMLRRYLLEDTEPTLPGFYEWCKEHRY